MGDPPLDRLDALSPLDGRYRHQIEDVAALMSEGGLVRLRLQVEAAWLLHLAEPAVLGRNLALSAAARKDLDAIAAGVVSVELIRSVKDLERETNHDVKAVEYALRKLLRRHGAEAAECFVHFCCTSEDINNVAYALMLKEANAQLLRSEWGKICFRLGEMTKRYAALPMLSRTHGQPAVPTTVGRELAVFAHRLDGYVAALDRVRLPAKWNGAVGNFNAHLAALPHVPWPEVARAFIETRLQLPYNPLTTQIESHDGIGEWADALCRTNAMLEGLCRDVWSYIGLGYFRLAVKAGETGSSTMPHKVNPIDFENAEGNLGVANALGGFLSRKLLASRLQRDLSDSTVLRNLGAFVGYSVLAYRSLQRGLGKIAADEALIREDLGGHWEILGEAAQSVLRLRGDQEAYERLKAVSRGQSFGAAEWRAFIASTPGFTDEDRSRLSSLTPETYLGVAAQSAASVGDEISRRYAGFQSGGAE